MFKVNNKETFIVNFEHVIAGWVGLFFWKLLAQS